MLLIKNGRVIDPAGKSERNADIVVKDGKIEKNDPSSDSQVNTNAKQDRQRPLNVCR